MTPFCALARVWGHTMRVLLWFALLLGGQVEAQGAAGRASGDTRTERRELAVVAGEVRDLAGAPLARVRVAVGKVPKAAESDSAGRFEVADVPVGEHAVQVTRAGYEPLDFTVQVPEPGRLEVRVNLRAMPADAVAALTFRGLAGVVRDPSGAPLAGAEIAHMGTALSATTDSAGRFAIPEAPSGPYLLRVRRLGFVPRMVPGRLDSVMAPLEIQLQAQGVTLAPTTVTGTAGRESFSMAGFYQRKATESGSFIEQDEIDRRKPAQLTDLFRSNTTLTVQRDRTGRQWLETRMAGQRRCVPILFIDGVYYRQEPGLIDGMAPPDQVRAVEVYYGRGTVPSAFFRPGSECGVVAVWTR
jgi:hypothetical protein